MKIKAQSNRLSIDKIASSQEPSLPPAHQKRPLRNSRSMTRSSSPTNSVLSTAITTVAPNENNKGASSFTFSPPLESLKK